MTGATMVEFVVVAPTLLLVILGMMQYATLFHAKSNLNYAAYEAARAGSVESADPVAIRTAFIRAMTGYYGGGTTNAQLAQAYARAAADIGAGAARIEILSPTRESFDDYASPALAAKLKISGRVIPNTNLAFLKCPYDNPGCSNDPANNASGQTLLDANLLKLRITYGIPESKQMPFVGRFYTYALSVLNNSDPDAYRKSLVDLGRIPVVVHTTIRMQTPAIENGNGSNPGAGNGGVPKDPGPGPGGTTLPPCPASDPTCGVKPPCDPATDPNNCRLPGCKQGDPCDPGCGTNYCCLLRKQQAADGK